MSWSAAEKAQDERARLAAIAGVTCEKCAFFKAEPDWGAEAGRCTKNVIGSQWIHHYRRVTTVCFWYIPSE